MAKGAADTKPTVGEIADKIAHLVAERLCKPKQECPKASDGRHVWSRHSTNQFCTLCGASNE